MFLSLADGGEDAGCEEGCDADGEAGDSAIGHTAVDGGGEGGWGVEYAYEECAYGDEGEGKGEEGYEPPSGEGPFGGGVGSPRWSWTRRGRLHTGGAH